jgi:hypothetical protein
MANVDEAVARLAALSAAELKAEWRKLVGAPVPRIGPGLMRLALAWELQSRAYGGLSREVRHRLAQEAGGKTRTQAPSPGMRLVREWQGKVHVVTVGEDRVIHWDGRSWNSLSEVARAITGTRWSGPAFFGLKSKRAA